jgi:hypothetical protein
MQFAGHKRSLRSVLEKFPEDDYDATDASPDSCDIIIGHSPAIRESNSGTVRLIYVNGLIERGRRRDYWNCSNGEIASEIRSACKCPERFRQGVNNCLFRI